MIVANAAVSMLWAANAHAVEMSDTFQVHGFMSQALIVTDHNDFFGPSSDGGGSLEYTELGLNASFRPLNNVLVAGQLLARQAGDIQELNDIELDYGVIDYQFYSSSNMTSGVQLGRFKNPLGLYNQTRDIAITRPSILLPQSIYFDRTRKPALSADGVSSYLEKPLNNGVLRFQIGAGKPRMDSQSEVSAFGRDDLGSYSGKTSYIGQLRYEHDGGGMILAMTYANVNARLDSKPSGPGSGRFSFQPWIFSFQYNRESWSVTSEYALRHVKSSGFSEPYNYEATGESWYIQFTRRLSADWQWLVRYDSLVTNKADRAGSDYEERTGRPAYTRYAKDWTTGLQWQPYSRFLISSEFHNIEGTGWVPFQDASEISSQEKYWNMLLFQVSYFF
ncbi:hypothetical protein [Salinicola halophyticus]|uniref:hypothetical protein n=1 Tax=Salinicola halophyticus TaxID=1808881 RepID=UPI003F47407F